MSFSNPQPHIYPYFPPPPFIQQPITTSLSIPSPSMLAKPLPAISQSTENNIRYSAFERPITTVFIGNISDKIPDALLNDVLGKCGNVLSWKRVQGASGKLQAFGFCEYDNPEATLRCIRLLNEFSIGEKALVVKVDPKTDDLLTEYKNKKQKAIEDREAEDVSKTEEAKKERIIAIHARELDDDNNSLNQIKKLIKESGSDLLIQELEKKVDTVKNLNIEEIDLDGDKKNIISKEIESFRNKHKEDETNEEKDRYRRIRVREKERRMEKELDRNHRHHRSRSRSKTNKNITDDEQHRKRSRGDSRTPSIKSKKRSESKDTHKSHNKSKKEYSKEIDEYDSAMYKKLEKKLREKEAAYQNRLQMWEGREKKKVKEYELDEDRKINKNNEIAEEARKLQIFFEDYDDEKWDVKYYRGSELERRYNARRNEELSDERDRLKELEQIEQTKQRLIKDDDPNAESIILQMEQSMQEHLQKRLVPELMDSVISVDVQLTKNSMNDNNLVETDEHQVPEMNNKSINGDQTPEDNFVFNVEVKENESEKDINENMKPDEDLQSLIINNTETTTAETDECKEAKHTQSITTSNISTIERNAMVKKIIDGIPTLKADLFAYPIEWKMVDDSFVESRIKPWVDKKITTYIGEEEPSLSMFICKQVLKHRTPDEILSDIAMVLEEEADVFVMKMWRLLIYVIEERKCGLDK